MLSSVPQSPEKEKPKTGRAKGARCPNDGLGGGNRGGGNYLASDNVAGRRGRKGYFTA